jgi:thiamine biosynthesis protein ThiS
MNLRINGETRTFDPPSVAGPLTVAVLLERLGIDVRHVGVERNRELVPKREFESTELSEGDALEIVTFVGGG